VKTSLLILFPILLLLSVVAKALVDLSSVNVDLTTAEGGDSIDMNGREDTRPEDENKDSSLNIICSADECNNILSNTCDSH